MRRTAAALAAALAACAAPRSTPATPAAETKGPAWTARGAFAATLDGTTYAFGVGTWSIPAKSESCPSAAQALEAAENAGKAELARLLEAQRPAGEEKVFAAATLQGVTTDRGWYDGDRKLYVLVKVPWPTGTPAPTSTSPAPEGGLLHGPLKEAIASAAAERCTDPARAACQDPARHDRKTDTGCACGDQPACQADYRCEARGGAKLCICRGASCPCDVLKCRDGQTCGDRRCY